MVFSVFNLDCSSTPGIICVGGDGIVNEVSHCSIGNIVVHPADKKNLLNIQDIFFRILC